MLSRNIYMRKNKESTFPQQMSMFGLKCGDFSNFRRVFVYLFLDSEISDSEEPSCQISAHMNNMEIFIEGVMGGVVSPSMLLMLNRVNM